MKRRNRKKSLCENQARIKFTDKAITAWGGIAGIFSKFLDRINLQWVEKSLPMVRESEPWRREIQKKVLAMFLTVLVRGRRFHHVSGGTDWKRSVCGVWCRVAASGIEHADEVLGEGKALAGISSGSQ